MTTDIIQVDLGTTCGSIRPRHPHNVSFAGMQNAGLIELCQFPPRFQIKAREATPKFATRL